MHDLGRRSRRGLRDARAPRCRLTMQGRRDEARDANDHPHWGPSGTILSDHGTTCPPALAMSLLTSFTTVSARSALNQA